MNIKTIMLTLVELVMGNTLQSHFFTDYQEGGSLSNNP